MQKCLPITGVLEAFLLHIYCKGKPDPNLTTVTDNLLLPASIAFVKEDFKAFSSTFGRITARASCFIDRIRVPEPFTIQLIGHSFLV